MCTCNLQCQRSHQCKVHGPRDYRVTSGYSNLSNSNNKPPVAPPAECLIHYEPHDASVTPVQLQRPSSTTQVTNSLSSEATSSSDEEDGYMNGNVDDTHAFQEAYLANTKTDLYRTYEDSGLDLSDKETSPRSLHTKGQQFRKRTVQIAKDAKDLNGNLILVSSKDKLITKTESNNLIGGQQSTAAHNSIRFDCKVPSVSRNRYEKDDLDTMSMTSLEVANIMAVPPSRSDAMTSVRRKKVVAGKIQGFSEDPNRLDNPEKTVPPSVKRKSKKGLNNFIEQSWRSFMDQSPPGEKQVVLGGERGQESSKVVSDQQHSGERDEKQNTYVNHREKVNRLRHLGMISPGSSGSSDTGRTTYVHVQSRDNSNNSSPLYSVNQAAPSVSHPRSLTYRNTTRTVDGAHAQTDTHHQGAIPRGHHLNNTPEQHLHHNQNNSGIAPSRSKCASSCSGSSNNSGDTQDSCQEERSSISLTTLLLSGYHIMHVKVYRRDEEFSTSQYTTHVVKDSSGATPRPNSTSSHGSANQKTAYPHVIVISESHSHSGIRQKLLPMDIIIEVS